MDMDFATILKRAVDEGISDVIVTAGYPLTFKISGSLTPYDDRHLLPQDTDEIVRYLYRLANKGMERFLERGDDDFSAALPGVARFRVNVFRQRSSTAAVIRTVKDKLPSPEVLHIPPAVMRLSEVKKGLVLVTGPVGSGKSTTLACLVDKMNREKPYHIITIEDPIEFVYRNDKSIVSQREVNVDTEDFATALRHVLRQAPNVILVGEMRDFETISTALTAAETGQYVLSTLHTVGAANTIDRIIDVFPPDKQQQIRLQLSMVLQAVISQQLIPCVHGGTVPAFEIMFANNAVRNLIREGQSHQLDNVIFSSSQQDMISMDVSLFNLLTQKLITAKDALAFSVDPKTMLRKLQAAGYRP